MIQHYTEITIAASPEIQEILVAELSPLQFDSFTQEEQTLIAYTDKENYALVKEEVHEILQNYNVQLLSCRDIENNVNWNNEWEQNFQPIAIGQTIYVRAQFHAPVDGYTHEIIIQPKMSFGTGHHETTQLMMELMLEQDLAHAACLDMGCGTGVLAILAEKLGAEYTVAIDYDPWCFENTQENFEINGMQHGKVLLGDSKILAQPEFLAPWLKFPKRIILSNITKNYNIENLGIYHNIAQPGNVILVSGFYESDLQDLRNEAENFGMNFVSSKVRNNWCAALFIQQ